MPSQEEYLDNLLKDVMNGEQTSESGTSGGVHGNFFNGLPAEYDDPAADNDSDGSPEVPEAVPDSEVSEHSSLGETAAVQESYDRKERYDVQDTVDMSSEEIERILAENAGNIVSEKKADRGSVDLETLLQEAEEADLKDINEMLQKADRNEPVDEGIIALLEQAQQQNVEIEWNDIEEQRHSSKPRKERGLQKLLGKLRRGKKGGKNAGKEKQPDNRKQNGNGEEEKTGEGRPAKESDGVPGEQDSILEGAAGSANSEMDELFDTMQALGSEQDPAVLPTEEKNNGDDAEGVEGSGTDTFTEGAWPELQGLMLGNDLENPPETSENTGEKTVDRNAGPGDILEDTAAVDELISGFGILDDADISEKAEGHVPEDGGDETDTPDVFDLLGEMEALTGESKDTGEGEETEKEGEKKSKRVKKSNKEGTDSKKKGLLGRILEFLTQEDNEVEEEQQIILSDENDAILKELNEENAKKKNKKKKNKKKKGADKEGGQADFEEDEEETAGKRGKSKKARPKKIREQKQKEPEEPGRRLSARRVSLIFLICGTIGIVLLLLCNAGIDFADKKRAASAFYEGDYETCYQNLMGKRLNESQQVMYGKSESILRMRLWMREYEMFVQAGQEPEALDSLLQSVYAYPSLYQFSAQWNALDEVQEIYGQMLEILSLKYGLTEEMAEAIANERDDLVYSQLVRGIAGGGTYDGWTEDQESREPDRETESLEDLLPEEEELGDVMFVD